MLTLQKIDGRIAATEEQPTETMTSTELKRFEENLSTLRQLRRYLETGPLEAHVKLSLEKAQQRLEKIENGYPEWLRNIGNNHLSKNPLQQYRTQMGRKELLVQIDNLKTLLEIE